MKTCCGAQADDRADLIEQLLRGRVGFSVGADTACGGCTPRLAAKAKSAFANSSGVPLNSRPLGAQVFDCYIDHIIVTTPTLERGAEFVVRALGVQPQVGGEHPRMGTHNLLLRLGDSLYLEVIANNPNAPKPPRPRWFALDDQHAEAEPRLAAWVARTDNIQRARDGASEDLGEVEAMTRGSLQWRITVPVDGSLPLGGVAPALIEWHTPTHPALNMQKTGCSLRFLEAFHAEPARVSALFGTLGFQQTVPVSPLSSSVAPYLVAHIDTPSGLRIIGATKTSLDRSGSIGSFSPT